MLFSRSSEDQKLRKRYEQVARKSAAQMVRDVQLAEQRVVSVQQCGICSVTLPCLWMGFRDGGHVCFAWVCDGCHQKHFRA